MAAWVGNRDPETVLVRCPFCGEWVTEDPSGNPFLRECESCEIQQAFSDLYKCEYGVRPRGFGLRYAKAWLARFDATH